MPSLIFVELSGNRLQGTLPPAFATALPNLLGLFLANNALTGTLPSEWAAMPSLSVFNLRNNKLSGTLPAAWGAWPNIRDLRLASNRLSSTLPAEYGSWTNIEQLALGVPQSPKICCLTYAYMYPFVCCGVVPCIIIASSIRCSCDQWSRNHCLVFCIAGASFACVCAAFHHCQS